MATGTALLEKPANSDVLGKRLGVKAAYNLRTSPDIPADRRPAAGGNGLLHGTLMVVLERAQAADSPGVRMQDYACRGQPPSGPAGAGTWARAYRTAPLTHSHGRLSGIDLTNRTHRKMGCQLHTILEAELDQHRADVIAYGMRTDPKLNRDASIGQPAQQQAGNGQLAAGQFGTEPGKRWTQAGGRTACRGLPSTHFGRRSVWRQRKPVSLQEGPPNPLPRVMRPSCSLSKGLVRA